MLMVLVVLVRVSLLSVGVRMSVLLMRILWFDVRGMRMLMVRIVMGMRVLMLDFFVGMGVSVFRHRANLVTPKPLSNPFWPFWSY
jgi:hypothetical protein